MARASTERSADAREQIAMLVARSKRSSGISLPPGFVRNEAGDGDPPLATLLRGGRGGEVRLKLYLSMTLLATRAPHDIKGMPARAWAGVLGLPDIDGTGARRVAKALEWLDQHKLIRLDGPPAGAARTVTLLSPSGTGKPYKRESRRYVPLPLEFWTREWILELSGAEVALLLVLTELTGGRSGVPQTVSGPRKEQYGLSEDTWTRATKTLRDELGLLQVGRIPQGGDFEFRRMRNTYLLSDLRDLPAPPARMSGQG